jgi:hypothetical protein
VIPAALPVAQVEPVTMEHIQMSLTKELKVADYEPITDSKNVEKFVKDYFADAPILANIAKCESRYRQYDKSGNVLRGEQNRYDVGVMQINELYHLEDSKELGLDIHSLEGNVAFARHLYEKSGAKPWMASSPCWAKFNHIEIALR